MNSIRKSLIIGMTVLGLGTVGGSAFAAEADAPAAAASSTPGAGHGHRDQAAMPEQRAARMAERQARFKEFVAKRQAKLHDALKLSAAQEPAWKTFIAASAPQWPAARPDRAAYASMGTPERAQQRLDMGKQRLARQETRVAALKTFYATLSPEQKKTFDDMARHGHGRRGWGHGHGGWGGDRGHGGMGRHG